MKNYHASLAKLIAILIVTVILSGCWLDQHTGNSGANYDNPKQRYWLSKLRQAKLQVVHRGSHVRLIIAGDYLFPIDRDQVKPSARALLQDIAHLIPSNFNNIFCIFSVG